MSAFIPNSGGRGGGKAPLLKYQAHEETKPSKDWIFFLVISCGALLFLEIVIVYIMFLH